MKYDKWIKLDDERSEIKDAIMRVQIDAATNDEMEQFFREYPPTLHEEHYWGQMKNLDYPMVK